MDLGGITALVTGGARRIGKAITLGLAAAGCDVVIHHGSSPDEAEATAGEARALGAQATVVQADLATEADRVFTEVADLAPIRVLVNSAAEFPDDSLDTVTKDDWSRTMTVNSWAPVALTQAFARQLGDAEGAVVNIGDWRVERPYMGRIAYSMSKGALHTFTLTAAASLAPKVRVNAVALGAMIAPAGEDESALDRVVAATPMGRAGGTQPAVDAVLFLIRNDFITGEIIRINGGAHLVG